MSPAPRALSLEVWLGPMEGLRYVADVRSAAQIARIGRLPFDKKERVPNQLVLSSCVGVSGSHALVRYTQGKLAVADLKSTNGTFVAGDLVSADTPVENGDIFLVSLTPLRVTADERPVYPSPPMEPVSMNSWNDAALGPVLRSARDVAAKRGERYIDSRHLAEAVLTSSLPPVQESLEAAGTGVNRLLGELWSKELFSADLEWIAEVLIKPVGLPADVDGAVVAPKVARFLTSAQLASEDISPALKPAFLAASLLTSILKDASGAVGSWLARHGVQPPAVAGAVPTPGPTRTASSKDLIPSGISKVDETSPSAVIVKPHASRSGARPTTVMTSPPISTPPPVTEPIPQASQEVEAGEGTVDVKKVARSRREPAVVPPPPPMTPVAPAQPPALPAQPAAAPAQPATPPPPMSAALERRARQLAEELSLLAAQNRFGTPDDRHRLLRGRVTKELGSVPRANKRALIERTQAYFPVVEVQSSVDAEIVQLRKQLAEQKRVEAGLREALASASSRRNESEVNWKSLVGGMEAPPQDKSQRILRDIVQFALTMENFLLGLIQSTTNPGDQTSNFRLPRHRDTLRSLMMAVAEGNPPSQQKINEYLLELQQWQVACLAAYLQAPKEWFGRLWKRTNPATIEGFARQGGLLRKAEEEWWQTYKAAVKDLGPDVVQDQVLQITSKLAQDEFERLRSATKEK
ncbi:MAG: FHA domain-containing protein [Acidobacteria bacterium]|nr:FHA domain-containing protein [Acidobacteriota bacterium]MCG3195281.1 hypothetical protein [Thermoanaerobaculia bacterium]